MGPEATIAAVLLAAVSMVGTALNAANQRKVARDKLEFDKKTTLLEARVAEQDDHIRRCDEQHEQTRTELAACRGQHERAEERMAAAERKADAAAVELDTVKAQLATLTAGGKLG